MNLLETKDCSIVRVIDIDKSEICENLLNRLYLFGIRWGKLLEVIRVTKSGCLVSIYGNQVAIGKVVGSCIEVEKIR